MRTRIHHSVVMMGLRAFCISWALFCNMQEIAVTEDAAYSGLMLRLHGIILRLNHAFSGKGFLLTAGACFVFAALWYQKQQGMEKKLPFEGLFSWIFGLGFVAGRIYLQDIPVTTSAVQTVKLGLCLVGAMLFVRALWSFLGAAADRMRGYVGGEKLKKPFLTGFLGVLLLHLPHLLIKYPAGFCYDAGLQLQQGMSGKMSMHHPLLHTLLLTWFTRAGRAMGSGNLGIFLFVVIQELVLAAVIGYLLRLMTSFGAGRLSCIALTAFFGLSPFVAGYVGQVIKDEYYSIFFLLFFTVLLLLIRDPERFWKTGPMALFAAATLLTCLMRNNGIHAVVPTLAAAAICLLVRREGNAWKKCLYLAALCVLPMLCQKGLQKACNAAEGSKAEMLALPFQQTARFARDYADECTDSERESIDHILSYDVIGQVYDPYICDPVKAYYKGIYQASDLTDYLRAWAAQGLRHPMCYVNATLQQNVFLIYPEYSNYQYFVCADDVFTWDEAYFHTPKWLRKLQGLYLDFLSLLHEAPVLSVINNMESYIFLMCLLLCWMLGEKRRGVLVLAMPMLMSLLVTVAAPCILYHPRYVFPVIYCFPAALIFALLPERTI